MGLPHAGGSAASQERAEPFFLLFTRPPVFAPEAVLDRMQRIEGVRPGMEWNGFARETLLRFEDHMVVLVAVAAPMPADGLDRMIATAPWHAKAKAPMREHRGHIACVHVGTGQDPTERFVATLKLAAALREDGLTGLVDPGAGAVIPAAALPALTSRDALAASRQAVPVGVWTGFDQLARPDGRIWFVSRGFGRWGAPDFACLGQPGEAGAVRSLFGDLLAYIRSSGAVIAPGQTASFGDALLRFDRVTEYGDWLGAATIVVDRIERNG